MKTFLFVLLLTLVTEGVVMADEQPINRRDLRRQIEHLHTELLRLQKQIARIAGEPATQRPVPDFNTLENTGVSDVMQPVNQTLADLSLAINRLQKREAPTPPAESHQHTVTTSAQTYQVRAPEGIQNSNVTLVNTGTDIIVNPRLVVNNKRNWYSTPDILNEVLEPGMTDREKALAIWRFLVDNRYHDQPAHSDIEVHDPVRFLNVYGYGFCDDSAANFMVLCEQAGIKARVWGLSGHVVPEAFFDNAWRMLDPDGEIYYLNDDGTIADVKTLEQRPDLIRKYPSPYYTNAEKLIEIYSTTEDNRISEWYHTKSEATHTLSFSLRPGEALTRSHHNQGRYFSSRYLSEPKRYGNGTFTFEPIFENNTFQKGAHTVQNLRIERANNTWTLVSTAEPGTLIYRFESPYPYLNGTVHLSGNGHVALSFSDTGQTWTDVHTASLKGDLSIPTGGYFRNGHGRPTYTYYLKLTLAGNLHGLRFENEVQVAPQSLPALEPGENTVQYIDETKTDPQVRIAFGYDLENPK